ncbi:MAG TPA: fasciclin domain-containing protein, partial [Candidatus Poseidoniales archaeon]
MNRALTLILVACLAFSTVAFNAAADETKDIPDNAAATGVHDSLVAALSHVDLVETLQGDGPFTVFAPTDEAFAAAGINLDDFDNDEANATLTDILLYHVVSAAVDAANVTDGMVATMANGDNATFTVENGTVMINDANVTTADVNASNGIIHVIDKVLMPPADESVEE